MIYFYKHKSMNELSSAEINLLGFDGVKKFALENNLDPNIVFNKIKTLESDIKHLTESPIDITSPQNFKLLNTWLNRYVDYFNKFATFGKQAYVIIGNIASGKSTFAREIEQETKSIIIDPDKYKMGEQTEKGYFEGLTSLYHKPTDRERMQEPCSVACEKTLEIVSDAGMNLIMPKASTSLEKLEKQLERLSAKNYDIHLILIDAPIEDCANRNYYRYLIKEYGRDNSVKRSPSEHGRFVPLSVITNIGDSSYETFVRALKTKGKIKFKSFKAYYNSDTHDREEIDTKTMQ